MKGVAVRNQVIGSGRPKICVPLTGSTVAALLAESHQINQSAADLVEWRVDLFQEVADFTEVVRVGQLIRQELTSFPLLVTFRTTNEGGTRAFSVEEYQTLYQAVLAAKIADIIDVEYRLVEQIPQLLEAIKKSETKLLFSNHDFAKTPAKAEIVARLLGMAQLNGDICKIAVMPHTSEDVLTLLEATQEVANSDITCPIVTMSMGQLGKISRISGALFGSAMTFGTVGASSAPGQIAVDELKKMLLELNIER